MLLKTITAFLIGFTMYALLLKYANMLNDNQKDTTQKTNNQHKNTH